MHGLSTVFRPQHCHHRRGRGLDLRSDYIPRDQLEKMIAQVKELRPSGWATTTLLLRSTSTKPRGADGNSTGKTWVQDSPFFPTTQEQEHNPRSIPACGSRSEGALRGDVRRDLRREGKARHDRCGTRQTAGGGRLGASQPARAVSKGQGRLWPRRKSTMTGRERW